MKALITGSTDGIGLATATALAKKGITVIIHGRSKERCEEAIVKIRKETPSALLDFIVADFTSLSEVRKMAETVRGKFAPIDILINNAAVYMPEKVLTQDSFETTFQVNYLSHFILTISLLNAFENSGGRIINVSSMAHAWATLNFENLNGEKHYDGGDAYGVSKLCNILFTYKLARELKDKKITVNALHPGVIGTKLLKQGWGMSGAPIEKGIETSLFLSTSESIKNITGKYFVDKKEAQSSSLSYNKELQEKLWNFSLTNIK